MAQYCTAAEFKALNLEAELILSDAEIEGLIEAASDQIDHMCNLSESFETVPAAIKQATLFYTGYIYRALRMAGAGSERIADYSSVLEAPEVVQFRMSILCAKYMNPLA